MKRNTLKKILGITLAMTMVLCMFAGCGDNGSGNASGSTASPGENKGTVELNWADHYPSGTPGALAIDAFCASVGEATEGRVTITAHHDAVLGAAGDALSMISSGIADIVWTSTAIFKGQFPYSDIMSLPMLGLSSAVDGTQAVYDLLEQYPEAFEKEYSEYHLLMMHMSPANIVGTKKAISSISDLAGLNIRAGAGSPTEMVTAWGAAPVAVATPDLYTSLQKGVIDGYVFDGSGINTWGLAELTGCMIDAGFGFNVCPVLMSQKAWNSISAEDQEIINGLAGRVGSLLLAEAMDAEAAEMVNGYTGEYIKCVPGDDMYEQLKAPLEAYVAQWAETMTTDTIDAIAMVDYLRNFGK